MTVLEGISMGGSFCCAGGGGDAGGGDASAGGDAGRGDVGFLGDGGGDFDFDLWGEEVTEEEVTCVLSSPPPPYTSTGPCGSSSEFESESPGVSVLFVVESTSPLPLTFLRMSGAPSRKACDVFSCAR